MLVDVALFAGVTVGLLVELTVEVEVEVTIAVGVLVGVAVGVGVVPHSFSSTEILLEPLLAVARSGLPSLSKSPIATDLGFCPTTKSLAVSKLPEPLPSSTDTLAWP